MAGNPDSEKLRQELAEKVTDELAGDLPRVSPYFGEDFLDSTDSEAQALREKNGTFDWVAFGFDPYPMWNAHVGVITTDGKIVTGFHVHERLSSTRPSAIEAIADEFAAKYQYSETATEHQFNCPPEPLDSANVDSLAQRVAKMCRQFGPIVDKLES